MKEDPKGIIELKYIDQKNEGIEAWIRKEKSGWVRLDFMLEYYVSGSVSLSKQYKGRLEDVSIAKEYYNLLYAKFLKETSDGQTFDFEKYHSWQTSDQVKINDLIEMINRS